MGNCVCVFKGIAASEGVSDDKMVKVVTSNGGIMELCTPITAELSSSKRITRQLSNAAAASATVTPYRMSTYDNNNKNRMWSEAAQVFPSKGVWKVKLVISPEQLSEIFSQESRTEAFIESLRTVAKCGGGVPSVANSDHWSLSSSWNGPVTKNQGLDG
ncbi:hypothetical protein E2542_SST11053 [Spatholobus suberectus]|nr:hypothetical protein E2542_SST11053 [Spatholobus suberectus]